MGQDIILPQIILIQHMQMLQRVLLGNMDFVLRHATGLPVSIADDRIEVIDLEGEVEEDDIDEIEEIVLIDEANNLEEIDQIEADETLP